MTHTCPSPRPILTGKERRTERQTMWLVVSSSAGRETDAPGLFPWLPSLSLLLFSKHSACYPSPQEDRPQSRATWRLQSNAPVPEPTSSRHSNGGHDRRASYHIFLGHDPATGVVNSSRWKGMGARTGPTEDKQAFPSSHCVFLGCFKHSVHRILFYSFNCAMKRYHKYSHFRNGGN